MSRNHGIQGPIQGIQTQLDILERLHRKELGKAIRVAKKDGIWEMKELVGKVAVMTVDERKEAFGILSMESLFTSRTYDQIKEAYDAWRDRPVESDCHNCACSVWYSREDGEITWLCIKEQPEKSIRVTLPNLHCEHWKAQGEN